MQKTIEKRKIKHAVIMLLTAIFLLVSLLGAVYILGFNKKTLANSTSAVQEIEFVETGDGLRCRWSAVPDVDAYDVQINGLAVGGIEVFLENGMAYFNISVPETGGYLVQVFAGATQTLLAEGEYRKKSALAAPTSVRVADGKISWLATSPPSDPAADIVYHVVVNNVLLGLTDETSITFKCLAGEQYKIIVWAEDRGGNYLPTASSVLLHEEKGILPVPDNIFAVFFGDKVYLSFSVDSYGALNDADVEIRLHIDGEPLADAVNSGCDITEYFKAGSKIELSAYDKNGIYQESKMHEIVF